MSGSPETCLTSRAPASNLHINFRCSRIQWHIGDEGDLTGGSVFTASDSYRSHEYSRIDDQGPLPDTVKPVPFGPSWPLLANVTCDPLESISGL